MTDLAAPRLSPGRRFVAPAFGLATLVGAFLIGELLVQIGVINRFIVPPPSEVMGSFHRIVSEERVFSRFLFTATECLIAGIMLTVFGLAGGVLMHRFKLLQQACEPRASAPPAPPLWCVD